MILAVDHLIGNKARPPLCRHPGCATPAELEHGAPAQRGAPSAPGTGKGRLPARAEVWQQVKDVVISVTNLGSVGSVEVQT